MKTFLVTLLGVAVFTILSWLIVSWWLMMLVGAIHGEWINSIPTIGYASASMVSIPLMMLAFSVRTFATYDPTDE